VTLTSERIELNGYHEWVEAAFERGWSDGLPVIPPTVDRVQQFVDYIGRKPEESLGDVPPKYGEATIEKLAIQCVMAGCKPEYFPVVIAALEAMMEPAFNLNGVQTTTHMNEPLVIVSGPIAKKLGMNWGTRVFGSGNRANGTIGRAVKLIQWNIGGSFPGEPDKSTFAHPGQWSYCIAEDPDNNPWEPLHVERGFKPEQSCVTVFGAEPPHSIICFGQASEVLARLTDHLSGTGPNYYDVMGETLLGINPTNAAILATAGYTKKTIKEYIWYNSGITLGHLKRTGIQMAYVEKTFPKWVNYGNDEQRIPIAVQPEDLHIVVAGGAGKFCVACPGWGALGGFAITKEIKEPRR